MKTRCTSFLFFSSLILFGFGCSATQPLQPPVLDQTTDELPQTTEEQTDLHAVSLSMNQTEWRAEDWLPGLVFFYPPELTYQTGGDIDTGSWSWLSVGDEPFAGIFSYALFTCPSSDPAECNLGTIVPATSEEVYKSTLASMQDEFGPSQTVILGNTTGEQFIIGANSDNSVRTSTLIKSKGGVFLFQDQEQTEAGGEVWQALLNEILVDPESELWIINTVFQDRIEYQPIEWYGVEEARLECAKDSVTGNCDDLPEPFYWRYKDHDDTQQKWQINDCSSLVVRLLCNTGDCSPDTPFLNALESMSYKDYIAVDTLCRVALEECNYYAIGAGMDFFRATFSKDGTIKLLTEVYVP